MAHNPARLDDELNLAAGIRYRLGEMLLQAGRITHEKLETAIEEQRRTGSKLGRILLRLGLDIGELDVALEFQQRQEATPAFGLLRLGELMVSTGLITREQMAASLSRQRLTGRKLGEDLVATGLVRPHQIAHTLQIQQKLVSAALITALALGSMSSSSNAVANHADTPAITTAVRKHASLNILLQPDELVIADGDIERGYVDVPGMTKARIHHNCPGGYLLVFENLSDFFRQTHVRGLGDGVKLAGKGGVVTRSGITHGIGESNVEMEFGFDLTDSARPGIYDWPMQISAMPL